ncbi:hypothetical protein P7K49_039915, partial [Saguinus oedipus]
MDCQKCPEGYRVTYTPMAPGSYLISIKYGGPYHIGGSLFKAKVTGEPGAKLLAPAQCLALWPPLSPTHSVLQPIPGALGPLLNTAQLCPCHGLLHQPVSLKTAPNTSRAILAPGAPACCLDIPTAAHKAACSLGQGLQVALALVQTPDKGITIPASADK